LKLAAFVARAASSAQAGKPSPFHEQVNEEVQVAGRKVGRRFLMLLVLFVVAGCGEVAQSSSTTTQTFPLRLTTTKGKVTIPRKPTRIVSLSPTATEDLFAVGAGSQVVAVDSYSTYPAEAPKTNLSAFTPNIEAIGAYQPDLVIVSDDTNGVMGQLAKLQIPTLIEPPVADLNGVYAQIEQIAQATGHSAQATTVVSGIQQKVQSILSSVQRPSRPLSVYHELDQTYYSANSHTFIGQMYKLLGLENIADRVPGSSDYPQLSAEYIISSDPDLIVLADTVCCGQSLDTVRSRPGWSAIKAVQAGGVVPVKDEIASQWGPRIVLFLQAVADALKKLLAANT
jgi:iron complex transport system substrate-binding protein